jgi:hypothetical protein
MRSCLILCLAVALAGCATQAPPREQVAALSQATPAPIAQLRPVPSETPDGVRAALAAFPECRAEILGFAGVAMLAQELGDDGEVFSDALHDLSSQVEACMRPDSDADGLIWADQRQGSAQNSLLVSLAAMSSAIASSRRCPFSGEAAEGHPITPAEERLARLCQR